MNVSFETTVGMLGKILEEYGFTYYHDGTLSDEQYASEMIATHLNDQYYSDSAYQKKSNDWFFLPVARVETPDAWYAIIKLEFTGLFADETETLFLQEDGAIHEDYNAFFVAASCIYCEKNILNETYLAQDIAFKDLEYIIEVAAFLDSLYATEDAGPSFVAANWEELYYGEGESEDTLLNDPDQHKADRKYNDFDTMSYGYGNKKTVSLLNIGKRKKLITDEEGNTHDEWRTVYLILSVEEEED